MALEFEAVGCEDCIDEADKVVIDSTGVVGVERWRLMTAKNGDASQGRIDIGLSDGSGLQGTC